MRFLDLPRRQRSILRSGIRDRGAIHEPRIDHDRVIQGDPKGGLKREREGGGGGEEGTR